MYLFYLIIYKRYKRYKMIMNYINWNTMIDIGFWSRLTKKKVE